MELLVVVAMLALIATLALPGRLDNPGATVDAVAGELAASLRRTRLSAIQTGQPTTFQLDLEGRRYRGHAESWQALPANLDLQFEGAAEVMTQPDLGAIRFFADGSASGGSITVGRGPTRRVVTTNWLLGTVRTARGQTRRRRGGSPDAGAPLVARQSHRGQGTQAHRGKETRCRFGREAGVVMMELLVAVAILAIALGALSYSSVTALRAQARAETITAAVHYAESALTLIGHASPLVPGEQATWLPNGWRQRVVIRPLPLNLPERANPRFVPQTYAIDLAILDQTGQELIRLETVKLGIAP